MVPVDVLSRLDKARSLAIGETTAVDYAHREAVPQAAVDAVRQQLKPLYHEAIAASKSGVVGLARSAAATYAPNNIRVNVVSPGLIRTDMTRRIWENATSSNASENPSRSRR